ncbi:MAG: membrane protein insertase YidC, partial [Acidobacteriota bacterium]
MEKRLILFLVLSSAIFMGWSYIYGKLYPQPSKPEQTQQASQVSPAPEVVNSAPAAPSNQPPTETVSPTQADLRQIVIQTDHWRATLSNQGAVITEWVMTGFTDGKPIDPPNGVGLVSAKLNAEIGSPLRFHIPSDSGLEQLLNSARYEIRDLPESEIKLGRGEKRSINFTYVGQGVEATKTILFRAIGTDDSSGFDFDFQATVKRNGSPVEAFIVIGPNFGDQNVRDISTYKHAPQLTYAMGTSVERENADALKETPVAPVESPVTWAAVDDNYFAMAAIPPRPVPAVRLVNNQNFVSIAVALVQGENYHVYAGPKDLETLSAVSDHLKLKERGKGLEDIVSYGWLNFISFLIKPIAQFMLLSMREINKITQNFGWSIVILTVILNMFFFPLRWKSSVSMKRAAAMQPKMKDLQERMKKLDKNDPRMLELQKEQISLMKEGNPLMGCLPLLLQMPFFMAVFAILTVSIEVRNAPFFGWLHDLSTPDPYWVLPIMMCVTMIVQQALTPSTVDPVQKKVGYVMPLIFTWFLKGAPAGLVLYWMVSNLVGVAQQFVINKLNPTLPAPPAPP